MKFSEEEERFLTDNEVGRLATIGKEGFPHAVPVCYIYHAGSLWVAIDYETAKYRNLQSNNKVALVVDTGYDANRGMVIQGLATVYERGQKFRDIYAIFHEKFNWVRANPWGEGEAPLIRIEPVRKACWGPRLT